MARIDQLVSLAIEIYLAGPRAMDNAKEKVSVSRWSTGGYSLREWAIDMLRLLPDDLEEAQAILKHHAPGGTEPEDRRRVGQLVGRYYKRLEMTELLKTGHRIYQIMK